jgi:hypothetical protein
MMPNRSHRFVDRDMFMRYRGGGVGHRGTEGQNRVFLEDELVQADDLTFEETGELQQEEGDIDERLDDFSQSEEGEEVDSDSDIQEVLDEEDLYLNDPITVECYGAL